MKLFGVVGTGGFGREVIPVAKAMLDEQFSPSEYKLIFIDEKRVKPKINDYIVLTPDEFFSHPVSEKFFNIAIAHHEHRKRISELMLARGVHPFTIKASNSMILDHTILGEGAILCPFTIITSNAKIGKYFHANIYAYVAHDCRIGDYVTFAPSVHCNGNVIIEDYAYIGTGAVIKQGEANQPLMIGTGAVVGMGAVVTKSVAAYETVIGNPAKPMLRHPESIAQKG